MAAKYEDKSIDEDTAEDDPELLDIKYDFHITASLLASTCNLSK